MRAGVLGSFLSSPRFFSGKLTLTRPRLFLYAASIACLLLLCTGCSADLSRHSTGDVATKVNHSPTSSTPARSVMFSATADNAETYESLKKAYDNARPPWRAEALVKLYNFEQSQKTFDFAPWTRKEKTIAFTVVSAIVAGSLLMFINSKSKAPQGQSWPAYCPPVVLDGVTYTCDGP